MARFAISLRELCELTIAQCASLVTMLGIVQPSLGANDLVDAAFVAANGVAAFWISSGYVRAGRERPPALFWEVVGVLLVLTVAEIAIILLTHSVSFRLVYGIVVSVALVPVQVLFVWWTGSRRLRRNSRAAGNIEATRSH